MTIKSESNWRGYCIKCDTVWEQGEKCKCETVYEKLIKNNVDSEEYLDGWNAAIEDVANLLDEMGEEARISEYVREMKK